MLAVCLVVSVLFGLGEGTRYEFLGEGRCRGRQGGGLLWIIFQ